MKERDARVNPLRFHAYGIPVGAIGAGLSRMSEDEATHLGIAKTREILKKEGLVFLDAHGSETDIVTSAIKLSRILPLKTFIAPVAASHMQRKVVGHLVSQINKVPGVEIYKVFRSEEARRALTTRNGQGLADYRTAFGLTRQEVKEANARYERRIVEAVSLPHHAVMIAPYGTRKHKEDDLIRGDVAKLLQTECAAICTYSEFKKGYPTYRLHTSWRILRFGQESSREAITRVISQEFRALREKTI